jgi:hypothetical protein
MAALSFASDAIASNFYLTRRQMQELRRESFTVFGLQAASVTSAID